MSENKPTFIQAIKAAQTLKTKISPETAATIPPTSPLQDPVGAVDK